MKRQNTTILERVNEIEKNFQFLKLECFLNLPEKQKQKKKFEIYKDENILNELKKIRKMLWNEKYSKAI